VTPPARVDPGTERVRWSTIKESVRQAYPDARIASLHAPLYRRSAAEVVIERPRQSRVRVYVDPYTARVLDAQSYLDVQRFLRSFHRRLFLPNPVGIYVVSLFAVTLLVSLVAALSFYKRWWRRFLDFRPKRGRALFSELHKAAGLWSLWFVVVMVVTGIWYGLEATGVPDVLLAPDRPAVAAEPATGPPLPFESLMRRVERTRPALDIRTLYPPGSFYGDDRLRVHGQGDDLLVRDRVNHVTVATDGRVLADATAADLTPYERWVHTADPLHFGDFAGLISKLIWFVFGLALSGLILTGTYLHARRLAHDAKGRHRWPGTGAAIVVSLLVLAASVPFGLLEAQRYGPEVDGVEQLPALAPGVLAVIAGWIAATLAIIAVWVWMLWRPRRSGH